jgi:DUF4097 and DUF4098 domain-containing protein YvlB
VNGAIVLENEVKIGTAHTVNGSLDIREGAAVAREASTVNGDVTLAKRARVGGDVSTVSGEIELHGAEVAGSLTSVNGDIELTDGARVLGGIHIRKNNSWGWGWGQGEAPGVELRVEPGAKIGKVIGEDVKRL